MAKILIVEDEAHIAHVMTMWLKRHGHDISVARNGSDALEILGRESVDLIISDMNMPVMDGLTLAKRTRGMIGPDIPFLLISARCDQSQLAEKLAPYHVHLYPKPFMPSYLVSEIERLLGAVSTVKSD